MIRILTVGSALLCLCLAAHAAPLKPYQQAALDRILATMDAETRAMARPQLEQTLSMLGEQEVEMMLAAMAAEMSAASEAVEQETPVEPVASPEDLEFNRAQYEPAIRKAWEAGSRFDRHVDAALAEQCPAAGTYAVWGQAWRYEVMPVAPNWSRASNSPDLDVQILGSSYAPQDGRYRFDFSGVRGDFDQSAVDRAIAEACNDYRKIGEAFLATARAGIRNDDLPGGFELEQRANAEASGISTRLEQLLGAQAPNGDGALFQALLNAERIAP